MAELSRSVLKKTLTVKYPDFFAVHFCETLLVLNNCGGNKKRHGTKVKTFLYFCTKLWLFPFECFGYDISEINWTQKKNRIYILHCNSSKLKRITTILSTDHPVYVSIASSGADGDSCPVNMEVRQTHTVSGIRHPLPAYYSHGILQETHVILNLTLIIPHTPGCWFIGP